MSTLLQSATVTIAHPAGPLDVPRASLFTFPLGGLFGFGSVTSYALLPAAREGLWWLMSPGMPR